MKKTTIAINGRFLIENKLEGIGYFTYETVRRIVTENPHVEFHLLFDRTPAAVFRFGENCKQVVLWPQARHPILWWWWFDLSVARYLSAQPFDLFLSPDGYCSLRSSVRTVAVQHDLAFEHLPQHVPFWVRTYYRHFVPRFMRHAARIATVSRFSKEDIVARYNIAPEKIDIVYSAAKEIFKPTDTTLQESTRAQHTGGKPYLIYVGAIHPRKNVAKMLAGFDLFKQQTTCDLQLVIAGAAGWQNNEVQERLACMQYSSEVHFLGRQPVEELVRLIGSAYALLYVSLFEGFGVPPLEGMACGVPVVASRVASIPEVCGDAALLVNPQDEREIAAAIARIWNDQLLRQKLINTGFQRASTFTWQQTANLLWHSCERALQ